MCSRYTFLADEQPVMLSTSWEPLDLTHGTPVMFPEEGPHAGAGVVARMRAIGQHIESVQVVVTARPVLRSEAEPLGEALGSVVMVIQRTYRTAERAVDGRHRGAHGPVRGGVRPAGGMTPAHRPRADG
ncbi:hypothetical protein GCM10023088_72930 [Actinomadura verrucosospora]|uniref:UTRA domain-containing protein n=1 Tax=Actinomadura verrucosospora TaxID=46165 RepID=UPI0031E72966